MTGLRVVVIGGGSGIGAVVSGLVHTTEHLTAVISPPVAVTDGEVDLELHALSSTVECIVSGADGFDSRANVRMLRAIDEADLIVIGPGELSTNIVPILQAPGMVQSIRSSPAERVYVSNVMTKHGESDGFAASDFLREINRYLGGPGAVDWAVLNYFPSLPDHLVARYRRALSEPVAIDLDRCYEQVRRLIIRPLTMTGSLVRHDPHLLGSALLEIAESTVARWSTLAPAGE